MLYRTGYYVGIVTTKRKIKVSIHHVRCPWMRLAFLRPFKWRRYRTFERAQDKARRLAEKHGVRPGLTLCVECHKYR